jgi:DHA1 family bicyclomycin/chloramphenicol resistance-like MFS transporter
MNRLGLDATAISSTTAISGLITLPLPFVIGGLSDRFGRKHLLAACYASVALGMLTLVSAGTLEQFWLSTALFAVINTTISMGSALVMDIVPADSAEIALARFSATPWLGGVIGYFSAGFVIQLLGFETTFLAEAILPLLSFFLILSVTAGVRRHLAAPSKAA